MAESKVKGTGLRTIKMIGDLGLSLILKCSLESFSIES